MRQSARLGTDVSCVKPAQREPDLCHHRLYGFRASVTRSTQICKGGRATRVLMGPSHTGCLLSVLVVTAVESRDTAGVGRWRWWGGVGPRLGNGLQRCQRGTGGCSFKIKNITATEFIIAAQWDGRIVRFLAIEIIDLREKEAHLNKAAAVTKTLGITAIVLFR